MGDLLFGTTLLAAFLGGVVALLAPCCVSVMLPAYLATGFQRRSGILAGTLVFALGVATVIVPIGLGATALSAQLSEQHLWVYSIGGAAMLVGGVAILAGWKPQIPMLPGNAPTGQGIFSVYGLGVFSGAASACCAPVLAGVAVLSGAQESFAVALVVSLTYVAGMVVPLALLALVWDRRDWGASKLLHGRQVNFGVWRLRRKMAVGTAASGTLLAVMGVLAIVQGQNGDSMAPSGWRVRVSADLQHWAANLTDALSWIPGWALLIVLVVLVPYLIRQALRYLRTSGADEVSPAEASPAEDSAEAGCCQDSQPASSATPDAPSEPADHACCHDSRQPEPVPAARDGEDHSR